MAMPVPYISKIKNIEEYKEIWHRNSDIQLDRSDKDSITTTRDF